MYKMNLNLNNYYLGIIKKHPNNYKNHFIGNQGWDPFADIEEDIAIEIGVPTIVIKDKDTFRDIRYSRFKGEIKYTLNTYNAKGIMLTHISPFLNYFDDFSKYPMIYTKSQNIYATKLQDYLPYLILPNYDGSERIYPQDIEPIDIFYDRYINDFCIEDIEKDMDNPYSLENYYIGIIVCDKDYYKKPYSNRFLGHINFDPFADIGLEDGIKYGVPTLLYKKESTYHDIMWKRFDNELKYKLGDWNQMGIKLIHIEPFLKWYPFKDILKYPVITQTANNEKMREIQRQMPFLASYNPKMNYFDIEMIDEEPMYNMYNNFYQKQFIKK